ncbi:hypothetical protein [Enterococcus italicus]|uniref:hypothetical protein n=1 Tax=Enterococcus italicus TaxID=246144 RepID=UPI003F485448
MSEKIAVILEFNGYTQDELQDYLTLKFVPMTKGGMTASFLSQTGYKRAKAVILDRPQLNENQKLALEVLKIEYEDRGNCAAAIYWALEDDSLPKLEKKEFAQVLQVFSQWALEQEEE